MTDIKENTSGQGESREIKFRAWDLERKKMLCHNEDIRMGIWFDGEINIATSSFQFNEYFSEQINQNKDNFILMQYTGIKDKNGVDIYEGDIFEVRLPVLPENMRTKQMVQYNNGMFCSGNMPIYLFDKTTLSVIGNIYENPELLSEK